MLEQPLGRGGLGRWAGFGKGSVKTALERGVPNAGINVRVRRASVPGEEVILALGLNPDLATAFVTTAGNTVMLCPAPSKKQTPESLSKERFVQLLV